MKETDSERDSISRVPRCFQKYWGLLAETIIRRLCFPINSTVFWVHLYVFKTFHFVSLSLCAFESPQIAQNGVAGL